MAQLEGQRVSIGEVTPCDGEAQEEAAECITIVKTSGSIILQKLLEEGVFNLRETHVQ